MLRIATVSLSGQSSLPSNGLRALITRGPSAIGVRSLEIRAAQPLAAAPCDGVQRFPACDEYGEKTVFLAAGL